MAINKVKQNEKYLQTYPAHKVLGTGYIFPLFLYHHHPYHVSSQVVKAHR